MVSGVGWQFGNLRSVNMVARDSVLKLGMAGQPNTRRIRAKLVADIEARGGEEWIFDQIAGGAGKPVSIAKLAKTLKVYRGHLDWWLKETPDRAQKLIEARRASAESYVDEATEILDNVGYGGLITGPEVSLATSRANHRTWLAKVRDREQFGDTPASVNLNISATDLHFNALRMHGSVALASKPAALPAQIIPDGSDVLPADESVLEALSE